MQTIRGSCHCGAVQFSVEVTPPLDVLDCNCSICAKKGILHLIVSESSLAILAGEDCLTTYTFGTHTAKHMFCRTCGIHPFYRPRSHPHQWDVNARCLDDPPPFTPRPFDGANWEQAIDSIR
jgi:hypothetical protein